MSESSYSWHYPISANSYSSNWSTDLKRNLLNHSETVIMSITSEITPCTAYHICCNPHDAQFSFRKFVNRTSQLSVEQISGTLFASFLFETLRVSLTYNDVILWQCTRELAVDTRWQYLDWYFGLENDETYILCDTERSYDSHVYLLLLSYLRITYWRANAMSYCRYRRALTVFNLQ